MHMNCVERKRLLHGVLLERHIEADKKDDN